MRIAPAFWRRSDATAASLTTVIYRPEKNNWVRAALMFALGLVLVGSLMTPLAATAQNLGTSPQFGQAVQGQQATTVEGTVLNIVNWACNVIARSLQLPASVSRDGTSNPAAGIWAGASPA